MFSKKKYGGALRNICTSVSTLTSFAPWRRNWALAIRHYRQPAVDHSPFSHLV